jgi:hypothetical protein
VKEVRLCPNFERESIMPCAVKSSFKTGSHTDLSRDQSNSYFSFDKNWF